MRRLHHIALGARDVEGVARFYEQAFELEEVRRHDDEVGELRSVWLGLGEGALLMVERTEEERPLVDGVGAGPFLIALAIAPEERAPLEARLERLGALVESRTGYTSYMRDPEGNRVAISHYPEGQGG